jgi:hypothetical protein
LQGGIVAVSPGKKEVVMSIDEKLYPRIAKACALTGAKPPEFLEKNFSRVLQKIELFWGEKEADDYFNSLMLEEDPDNRGRPTQRKDLSGETAKSIRNDVRQGFPDEAVVEIGRLRKLHDYLFPITNTLDTFYNPLERKKDY